MRLDIIKRFFLVSLLTILFTSCVVVEDGTEGVSRSFGKIKDDVLVPGIYPMIPVIREVEVWNIKTQRRTLKIATPSTEGLNVQVEATLLFRPTDVVSLRKTVGIQYVETVIDPTLRNVFREVIGKQQVEAVYRNPEKLAQAAKEALIKAIDVRGLAIEDLLVTDIKLPSSLMAAIERKLESEQKAFEKEFELLQANKNAEIEVVKAKGLAEAQQIVRETLSPLYLQYLWISTLNQNPNVIYVATEANMPLFRTASNQ